MEGKLAFILDFWHVFFTIACNQHKLPSRVFVYFNRQPAWICVLPRIYILPTPIYYELGGEISMPRPTLIASLRRYQSAVVASPTRVFLRCHTV